MEIRDMKGNRQATRLQIRQAIQLFFPLQQNEALQTVCELLDRHHYVAVTNGKALTIFWQSDKGIAILELFEAGFIQRANDTRPYFEYLSEQVGMKIPDKITIALLRSLAA